MSDSHFGSREEMIARYRDLQAQLEREKAACLGLLDGQAQVIKRLEAENAALRRHADNMALAIECAEGFEARDLDFAFDYRQWSKGK